MEAGYKKEYSNIQGFCLAWDKCMSAGKNVTVWSDYHVV